MSEERIYLITITSPPLFRHTYNFEELRTSDRAHEELGTTILKAKYRENRARLNKTREEPILSGEFPVPASDDAPSEPPVETEENAPEEDTSSGKLSWKERRALKKEEKRKKREERKKKKKGDGENLEVEPEGEPAQEKSKKGFRKINKKGIIFDYSELEHEAELEEVAELINSDGYYDEILPDDFGDELRIKSPMDQRKITILLISLAAIVGSIVYFYFQIF